MGNIFPFCTPHCKNILYVRSFGTTKSFHKTFTNFLNVLVWRFFSAKGIPSGLGGKFLPKNLAELETYEKSATLTLVSFYLQGLKYGVFT